MLWVFQWKKQSLIVSSFEQAEVLNLAVNLTDGYHGRNYLCRAGRHNPGRHDYIRGVHSSGISYNLALRILHPLLMGKTSGAIFQPEE
ncbi:unnamed protein product [Allacma fusca]|uniref:Uncharacterized protein n=1 Tax=Allacma fusca TaxID=39272 RepID=A0A8J2KF93_9HEXA|nr:unnamed protein product [Allacma fusca]